MTKRPLLLAFFILGLSVPAASYAQTTLSGGATGANGSPGATGSTGSSSQTTPSTPKAGTGGAGGGGTPGGTALDLSGNYQVTAGVYTGGNGGQGGTGGHGGTGTSGFHPLAGGDGGPGGPGGTGGAAVVAESGATVTIVGGSFRFGPGGVGGAGGAGGQGQYSTDPNGLMQLPNGATGAVGAAGGNGPTLLANGGAIVLRGTFSVADQVLTSGTGSFTGTLINASTAQTFTYSIQAGSITLNQPSAIQSWRQRYFGTVDNAGQAADLANPAGDGLPNLVKYALGLDPTKAETSPVMGNTSSGYLTLTVPKNPNASDVTYTVQVNGELTNAADWTSSGTTMVTNTGNQLVVQDNTPVSGTAKRFMRLLVSR